MKMLKIPFTPAEDHTLTPTLSLRERGEHRTLTPTLSLRERGKGGTARGLFPLPRGEG